MTTFRKLFIVMAVFIALGIVSFFNQIAALVVIVVAVVIMGFMWKIVYEKYANE